MGKSVQCHACIQFLHGSLTAIPLRALQLLHVVVVGCQATSSKPLRMQSDGWPYSKVSKYRLLKSISSCRCMHVYIDVTCINFYIAVHVVINVYIGYTSGFHTGF